MATLILTPLKAEFEILKDGFQDLSWEPKPAELKTNSLVYFKSQNIFLGVGSHGKVQFALQTQFLINNLSQISAVVCAGSAGSITEHCKVHDVVVATETVEHDFHVKFKEQPLPRFPSNSDLLTKFKKNIPVDYKIHFAPIASGDEDILEAERATQIHLITQAYAAAWEGAGGSRASRFTQRPFIEIRGISDSANKQTTQDFTKNLNQAMLNVATTIALAW